MTHVYSPKTQPTNSRVSEFLMDRKNLYTGTLPLVPGTEELQLETAAKNGNIYNWFGVSQAEAIEAFVLSSGLGGLTLDELGKRWNLMPDQLAVVFGNPEWVNLFLELSIYCARLKVDNLLLQEKIDYMTHLFYLMSKQTRPADLPKEIGAYMDSIKKLLRISEPQLFGELGNFEMELFPGGARFLTVGKKQHFTLELCGQHRKIAIIVGGLLFEEIKKLGFSLMIEHIDIDYLSTIVAQKTGVDHRSLPIASIVIKNFIANPVKYSTVMEMEPLIERYSYPPDIIDPTVVEEVEYKIRAINYGYVEEEKEDIDNNTTVTKSSVSILFAKEDGESSEEDVDKEVMHKIDYVQEDFSLEPIVDNNPVAKYHQDYKREIVEKDDADIFKGMNLRIGEAVAINRKMDRVLEKLERFGDELSQYRGAFHLLVRRWDRDVWSILVMWNSALRPHMDLFFLSKQHVVFTVNGTSGLSAAVYGVLKYLLRNEVAYKAGAPWDYLSDAMLYQRLPGKPFKDEFTIRRTNERIIVEPVAETPFRDGEMKEMTEKTKWLKKIPPWVVMKAGRLIRRSYFVNGEYVGFSLRTWGVCKEFSNTETQQQWQWVDDGTRNVRRKDFIKRCFRRTLKPDQLLVLERADHNWYARTGEELSE